MDQVDLILDRLGLINQYWVEMGYLRRCQSGHNQVKDAQDIIVRYNIKKNEERGD